MKGKKTITDQEVSHVAKLARLKIDKKDISKFRNQLSDILDYLGKLNEVSTENVQPTNQVTGIENVLREDLTDKSLDQKNALSGIKDKSSSLFKVDAIFEDE